MGDHWGARHHSIFLQVILVLQHEEDINKTNNQYPSKILKGKWHMFIQSGILFQSTFYDD